MNQLENVSHQQILDTILRQKGIKKTDFAVRIGFSAHNYTKALNALTYSNRTIRKICDELGIEPTVFGSNGFNESMMPYESDCEKERKRLEQKINQLTVEMMEDKRIIIDLQKQLLESKK
jgi:DNA-binding Xre family transcriptional regulator